MSSATTAPAVTTASTGTGAHNSVKQRRATSRGVSVLMYAAQQGDVEKVRRIVRGQPSLLLDRDRTGKSPLHYTCTSDNIYAAQAADLLVMAAPDLVESRDEDGFTPLHLAVIAGNMPLVTFLLANNADVNAVDNEKHTVVHWATVCGETAALRAILAAGAPVSTPDVHGGFPLHYAAQMCGGERDSNLGFEVLQTLLTHSDIVVSVADGDGRQPLLWAASAGSAKAVVALIRAGAGVEAPDKDGLTALHCAASRGHTDCIDTLLTLCGASPDVIDSNGCTALHYAVTLGHADATAILLAHGADPNRQDRKGRSPGHCGCAKGQFETVKMIGSHGANLWLRNARGDLPLHEAAASGRRDLVKWLLEMRPSQVNARNNDGRCPLHLAALNDNADMCKILLDSGAQINPILRTSKNVFMTPLDCALQRGFRSTAKYLQLHGGVPASRLGDHRQPQPPGNSAVSLQIRDDVTFWGDTSSDSERENGAAPEKQHKRSYRKKLANKYDRKRASLSGSDAENQKLISGKLETGKGKRKLGERNKTSRTVGRIDSAVTGGIDPSKRSSKLSSSSRLDYNNEIIINGKTEINIHQTKEIIIDKEINQGKPTSNKIPISSESSRKDSKLTVPTDTEKISSAERDKRPKSAKYSRVREKSAATQKIKTSKPDLAQEKQEIEINKFLEKKKEIILRDQSTNTSEDTAETVIESNKAKLIAKGSVESKLVQSSTLADQQSIMSNTSEDVDEQKDLVVEASVHTPPKEFSKIEENGETTAEKQMDADKAIETETEIKTEKEIVAKVEEDVNEKEINLQAAEGKEGDIDGIEVEEKNMAVISETQLSALSEAGDGIVSEEKSSANITEEIKTEDNTEELTEVNLEEGKSGNGAETEATNSVVKEIVTSVVEVESSTATPEEKIETNVEDKSNIAATEIATEETQNTTDISVTGQDEVMPVEAKIDENQEKQKELDEDTNNYSKEVPKETDSESSKDDLAIVAVITDICDKQNITANIPDSLKAKVISDKSTIEKDNVDGSDTKKDQDTSKGAVKTKDEKSKKQKLKRTDTLQIEDTSPPKNDKSDIKADKASKGKKLTKTVSKNNDVLAEKNTTDEPSNSESESSSSSSTSRKTHKSFRILDDEVKSRTKSKKGQVSSRKESRSRSEENKTSKDESEKLRRSKIPTRLTKTSVSKSDKHLDKVDKLERKVQSSLDARVPSLPNIHDSKEHPRCESNMSAPLLASVYSDDERGSGSDLEDVKSSAVRKKRVRRRRSKTRDARSAGSDYESSNLIDSGFEPSPRSSRIPKWKNMSDRGVNMTSVTQTIQSNIRKYHLERKIFQHLLELKRNQIRAGQHNEAILVKRAIDSYHQSCASTVGAGRYIPQDYSFKSFEKFLYQALRKLQKNGADHLRGLPETQSNPLLCTQSTHRCMHATHAYTGIPCAAYLPKMDHHTIPKIGFTSCKPGTAGFLPNINQKKAVTLELSHGADKQVISLPTDRLDQNKRYYVTFTVKGHEGSPPTEDSNSNGNNVNAHTHSKSD